MGALIRLGVSSYRAPTGGGGGGGATLVARTWHEWPGGAPDTFAFNHAGASPGDTFVAYLIDSSGGIYLNFDPAGTPHTFTSAYTASFSDPAGYVSSGYTGQLTSADLASGQITTSNVNPSGGGFGILIEIWTGVSAFAFKDGAVSGGGDTTLILPAFANAGAHKGANALILDAGPGTGPTITGTPGTWVQNYGPLAATYFTPYGVSNTVDHTNVSTTLSGFSAGTSQRALIGEFT